MVSPKTYVAYDLEPEMMGERPDLPLEKSGGRPHHRGARLSVEDSEVTDSSGDGDTPTIC